MKPIKLPPLDRFDIPQVAKELSEFGVTREHIGEYLFSGKLRAICFPYEEDPLASVEIAPEDWRARYREPYEFSFYEDWFGDEDLSELGRTDPVHMLPDSASEGPYKATSAVVYILRAELTRFIREVLKLAVAAPRANTSTSRSAKSTGRPRKNDYSEIDKPLEKLVDKHGAAEIREHPSKYRNILVRELGETASKIRPATLNAHIQRFASQIET